jgi:PqqD family protein of HPr-rel-A system
MNRWMLTYGADLACRFWGEECVVHHALSNDTHRLSAWAGQLLLSLADGARSSAELSTLHAELDAEDIDAALTSLAGLELVRRCR